MCSGQSMASAAHQHAALLATAPTQFPAVARNPHPPLAACPTPRLHALCPTKLYTPHPLRGGRLLPPAWCPALDSFSSLCARTSNAAYIGARSRTRALMFGGLAACLRKSAPCPKSPPLPPPPPCPALPLLAGAAHVRRGGGKPPTASARSMSCWMGNLFSSAATVHCINPPKSSQPIPALSAPRPQPCAGVLTRRQLRQRPCALCAAVVGTSRGPPQQPLARNGLGLLRPARPMPSGRACLTGAWGDGPCSCAPALVGQPPAAARGRRRRSACTLL
jgi:hypothetical protein